MARPKRGMHVWQCNLCSYWSERKRNVERHNNSIHKGNAFVLQAYAALVIEPSYRVTPVDNRSFADTSSLSPRQAVAFDTRMFSKRSSSIASTTNKDSIEDKICKDMDCMIAQMEERMKPYQKMKEFMDKTAKFQNLIQTVTGARQFAPFAPMPGTLLHTQTPYNYAGYKGGMCDKCISAFITGIPANIEHSNIFRDLTPLESHHQCQGERKFESEQARLNEKAKFEKWLIDTLIRFVKFMLVGKKMVLVAKRLDYVPDASLLIFKYRQSSSSELIQRAIKAGTIEINDEELEGFLRKTRSTAAIFFAFDTKPTTYYGISIQGQAIGIEEEVNALLDSFLKSETSQQEGREKETIDNNNSGSKSISNPSIDRGNTSPSSEEFVEIKGTICDKCLDVYLYPLLRHPNPQIEETYSHVCTGPATFESEQARELHRKQSEKDLVDQLIKLVRVYHPEGKIALAAINTKRYNFGVKGPGIEYDNNGKEPKHYISRAINEQITLLDDKELYDFFVLTRSTHGLFKVAGTGDEYTVFVYGAVKEDKKTSSAATQK